MSKELECKCWALELTLLLAIAMEKTSLDSKRRNEVCDLTKKLINELEAEAEANG